MLKLSKIQEYTCEDDVERRPKRQQQVSSVLLAKECIFCRNQKRTKNQARELLTPCVEFRAVKSIESAAQRKKDYPMLGLLANDLIAVEAHYHKSCYKQHKNKL